MNRKKIFRKSVEIGMIVLTTLIIMGATLLIGKVIKTADLYAKTGILYENEFVDETTLSKIKPHLKEQVDFYKTSQPFEYRNTSYIGMYFDYSRLFPINDVIVFSDYIDEDETLCHELLHRHWAKFMKNYEKQQFIEKANQSGKLNIDDINEIYARVYEDEMWRCFDES